MSEVNQAMTAKQNDGMASTQTMIRVAEILNGRGAVEDVEPALQESVRTELDFMLNQRKSSAVIEEEGNAEPTPAPATDTTEEAKPDESVA